MTAKMQGTIKNEEIDENEETVNSWVVPLNTKTYKSETKFRNHFQLEAQRLFFIKKTIIIRATQGKITVNRQPLQKGGKTNLNIGSPNRIEHNEDDSKIKRTLMANI